VYGRTVIYFAVFLTFGLVGFLCKFAHCLKSLVVVFAVYLLLAVSCVCGWSHGRAVVSIIAIVSTFGLAFSSPRVPTVSCELGSFAVGLRFSLDRRLLRGRTVVSIVAALSTFGDDFLISAGLGHFL
jgi:hypothetical protein